MQAIPFTTKIELQKNDYVMTYRSRNALGADFFCYIRCNLEGYTKMLHDYENKIADTQPNSYGEVIYFDSIQNPDEKAKKFLQEWLKDRK